mgnify:CR=1 FL=1
MEKIIHVSLLVLTACLAVFVAVLSLQNGEKNTVDTVKEPTSLGGFESQIVYVASTTETYFHQAGGTRTATTTLLTIDGLKSAEKIGLSVTVGNATNSPGTIYILPQVSTDAITWKVLAGLHTPNGAAGAFVSDINLGNGSTTQFVYAPGLGTTSVLTWFDTPVLGTGAGSSAYMRFQVWTTGTSSVLLEGYKLLK